MVAGLPGTGIGGIFYLILAVAMPIRELSRTLQGKFSLSRWAVVTLQLSFVFGIFVVMWAEVWLLNCLLIWLQQTYLINCPLISTGPAFTQTKTLAFASAFASFISLVFVTLVVHLLRFWVNTGHKLLRPIFALPGLLGK